MSGIRIWIGIGCETACKCDWYCDWNWVLEMVLLAIEYRNLNVAAKSQYNFPFIFFLNTDDFLKQTRGMMCFYSLKNPSYPE